MPRKKHTRIEIIAAGETWLRNKKSRKGGAPGTYDIHLTNIKYLAKHTNYKCACCLTEADLLDALNTKSKTCMPHSLNGIKATYRQFIEELLYNGQLSAGRNIAARLENMGFVKKHREIIPHDMFPMALDAAGKISPKCRMTTAFGLNMGSRGSEISLLQIKHVLLDRRIVGVFQEKTQKFDGFMPIDDALADEFKIYFDWFLANYTVTPESYLIPARAEGRKPVWSPYPILRPEVRDTRPYIEIKLMLTELGFPYVKGEGIHTLRRSAARAWYDELHAAGYPDPIGVLQKLLHHSTRVITERYLGLDHGIQERNDLMMNANLLRGPGTMQHQDRPLELKDLPKDLQKLAKFLMQDEPTKAQLRDIERGKSFMDAELLELTS